MGKDTKSNKDSNSQREERRLWQINEVTITESYTKEKDRETGQTYYKRKRTSAASLPDSFYEFEWVAALEDREASEKQAYSSGVAARDARRRNDGKLLSQEIANNPHMVFMHSSTEAVKQKRSRNKTDDGKG